MWDLCHPETVRAAPGHQTQARQIAAELAKIARTGMVLPGSITERRTRCGHPGCACHADPPRLHGPYWQWTAAKSPRKQSAAGSAPASTTTTPPGSTTTAGYENCSTSSKPSASPPSKPAPARSDAATAQQNPPADHRDRCG